MQPGARDKRKSPQKIMHKMHEMSAYVKEMVMALPGNSEGESEEELEYTGKGATLVDWEEFHKQQIQFAQYEFDKKEKVARKLQAKCELLENKLKKAMKTML